MAKPLTIRERFTVNGNTGPSFDFIRLAAALLVIYDHCFLVTGYKHLTHEWMFAGVDPGAFAVAVFFSLSGYVNAESFRRDPRAGSFLLKRALRLYPALIAVVLACTIIVAPLVTALPVVAYFTEPRTALYLLSGLLPLWQTLPGVFDTAPSHYVNGSLWTLRYEIFCYLGLAAFGQLIGARRAVALAAAVLSIAPTALAGPIAVSAPFGLGPTINQALPLFGYFAGGVCISLFAEHLREYSAAIAAAAVVVVAGMIFGGFAVVFPLAGSYLVVVLGNSRLLDLGFMRRFAWWGDFSYGTYIWAFPVQQLIYWAWPRPWWFNLALGIPLTLAMAMASWHVVERPCLKLKTWLNGRGRSEALRNLPAEQP